MKKTLVAIAALAAATGAMAQSSVTITGIADAGYQSGKEFGQNATMVQQNGSRTSALKFVGVEDLGGGLKAKFQIGTDMSITANDGNNNNIGSSMSTTPATLATANGTAQVKNQASAQSGLVGAEQNYVGLAGNFGEVQFGTVNTNTLSTFGMAAQNFGTAIGSGYKKGIYGGYTRYENSMVYMTPTFNGFSARYQNGAGNASQYSLTGTSVTLRRPTIDELGVNYAQGPLTASYSNLTSKNSPNEAAASANVKTTITTFAAAYDLGVAKIAFGMQNTKDDAATALDTKASNLSVTAPYGKFLFLANTGSLKYNAGTGVQTTGGVSQVGQKNTITGLGVHYNLSKNSYIYLLSETQKLDALAYSSVIINGAAGTATSDHKRNVTAIGFSQAF